MARAIVCLPSHSDTLLSATLRVLKGVDTKVFNSVDDGFEYLWNDGQQVGLFVLDLHERHVDELLACAANWPNLHFVCLHEPEEISLNPTGNVLLIQHRETVREVMSHLDSAISKQIPRLLTSADRTG